MKKKKNRAARFWALKVFIITLILTAGISVAAEALVEDMSALAAAFVILLIILLGIVADIVGIAFATCDTTPFVSMAAKRIKRAKSAIRMLQNADIVSNICGDVIGDICGIVSGAAGAAVAVKLALTATSTPELVWTLVVSSLIAALTVAGKALGKTFAIRNNKQIVSVVSYVAMLFMRDKK